MASNAKTVSQIARIGKDFRTTAATIRYRLRWELMLQIEEAKEQNQAADRERIFRELGLVAPDGTLLCLVSLVPATSWDHAYTLKNGYGWGTDNLIPLCEQINRHEKDHLNLDEFIDKFGHKYPGAAERAERFHQLAGGKPAKVSEEVQKWVTNKTEELMKQAHEFSRSLLSAETASS